MKLKIHILKPCFTLKHFKSNIFRRSSGKIDIWCFIHALSFGILFFERTGLKHEEANKLHLTNQPCKAVVNKTAKIIELNQ